MLGFLLGAFTIVGFESAANLAEETNDPERVVPRAMWQAVLASGVLGFFFIVAVTLAAGDPVALAESGTPIADVIDNTLGSAVATLLLVMVVLAIFACGLVIMMTGVRLTWAMSRDERFPGWQQWNQISPTFHTPLKATVLYVVLAELILAIFSHSETALFTLFGAATLLPAVMYASTVVLYLIKRKSLPVSDKFNLGAWEIPILVVAVVWLVFELALFRDSSFKQAWAYVIVMVVIGACYLGYLLVTRGRQRPDHAGYAFDRRRTDTRRRRADDAPRPGDRPGHVGHEGHRGRRGRPGRRRSPRSRCGRSTCRAAASSRIPRRCSTRSSAPGGKPWRRPTFRWPPWRWPTRAKPCWPGTATPGAPLTPAVVWQDRRAESICAPLSGVGGHRRAAHRAGARPVLLRTEDGVDPGEHDDGGRGHHHRHLAGAPAVRRVRHRRVDGQPVAADRAGLRRMGRRAARPVRADRRGAARDRRQRPDRRQHRCFRADDSGRRADRRPAGRTAGRKLPDARRCQVHIRHRRLPAGPARRQRRRGRRRA